MNVSDEMLMALADGELSEAEAAPLRARLAQDPKLQEDYAIFARSAELLRRLAPREADDPVPARLIAAIAQATDPKAGAQVVDLAARRARKPGRWGAMAASILLAFAAGWGAQTWQKAPGQPYDLLAALPTGGTFAAGDDHLWRVLGSYDSDIGLCRLVSDEAAGGIHREVICRTHGGWQRGLRLSAPQSAEFQTASDAVSASLESYLDAIGAGPALTPAEEAAALKQ